MITLLLILINALFLIPLMVGVFALHLSIRDRINYLQLICLLIAISIWVSLTIAINFEFSFKYGFLGLP